MQRLEVSGAVRPIYGSLGVKGLKEKRIEAVGVEGGCRKNFVGGKFRIMNGETKDWEEKETERGKCTELEAELSL